MKTSIRWLGLLGAAVIASFVSVSAYSSIPTKTFTWDSTSVTGCVDDWVGDAECDERNNNAECGE